MCIHPLQELLTNTEPHDESRGQLESALAVVKEACSSRIALAFCLLFDSPVGREVVNMLLAQICVKVNEAKRDAESAVITRSYVKRIYRSDGILR